MRIKEKMTIIYSGWKKGGGRKKKKRKGESKELLAERNTGTEGEERKKPREH